LTILFIKQLFFWGQEIPNRITHASIPLKKGLIIINSADLHAAYLDLNTNSSTLILLVKVT
jgi:hypothetical protein